MTAQTKDFLTSWVAENIRDEPYTRIDAPDPRPATLATKCMADAARAGITEAQLCQAASDLHGAGSLELCMALELDICAQKHLMDVARQGS